MAYHSHVVSTIMYHAQCIIFTNIVLIVDDLMQLKCKVSPGLNFRYSTKINIAAKCCQLI